MEVDWFLLTAFLLTACGVVIGIPSLTLFWLIKRAPLDRVKIKRAIAAILSHAHRVRGFNPGEP